MSQIEHLCRDYGDFRIEIPQWSLADQGVTALWGPSGAGKTSVFRLLIGLDPCPRLKWLFKGQDLAALPVPEKRFGVVFQNLELFSHMTAEENIVFAARARRLEPKSVQTKLDQLFSVLQLSAVRDRPAHVLSGGERQRVALARALIGEPRFLFLDEPFSSLDADLRREARHLVRTVIQPLAIPTLLITHDPEDLSALADHVVKIRNGRLVDG